MRFHEYETITASHRRASKQFPQVRELTRQDVAQTLLNENAAPMDRALVEFDTTWEESRRPYYRIYPALVPMLTRLNLSTVQGSSIHLPSGLPCLSVQFPVGHELRNEVRTMWFYIGDVDPAKTWGEMCGASRGLCIGLDYGEEEYGVPIYLLRVFPLSDQSIEESLNAVPVDIPSLGGKSLDSSVLKDAIRLACTLCLIGDDPSILEPEVLAKDRHRLDESNVQQLVEKAQRRGKVGWALGRSLETIPHVRRPHPALVWTGAGRTTPKVIMRKGSVVHRAVVAAVPTGYGRERNDNSHRPMTPASIDQP